MKTVLPARDKPVTPSLTVGFSTFAVLSEIASSAISASSFKEVNDGNDIFSSSL